MPVPTEWFLYCVKTLKQCQAIPTLHAVLALSVANALSVFMNLDGHFRLTFNTHDYH